MAQCSGLSGASGEHAQDQTSLTRQRCLCQGRTRAISNTTLSEEYQILHRTFGWDEGHFLHCNLNALDAAFADEPTKARLREALVKGYEVDGGR